MAAPNLALISNIKAQTAIQNVITVTSNVIWNPAASGQAYKINTLIITNVHPANTVDISVAVNRNSYNYRIANTITVSPKASLISIGKDMPIYLEEGDGLALTASTNASAEAVVSYDILS